MEFKESETYKNLIKAYEGKLKLSSTYHIYSDIARQGGYIEISSIYKTTSEHELEHARIWLSQINQGTLPDTSYILQESESKETTLASNEYQEYARIAKEEGFPDIASLFSGVANIDYSHGLTFQQLKDNISRNQIFCKPGQVLWICMKCGNILVGECAPEICPVCKYPQGYYKVYSLNV